MHLKVKHIFFGLCTLFIIYSFTIYMQPLSASREASYDKNLATEGKLIWQRCNCQSCHQLFGLGGYLGPDLTGFMVQPRMGLNTLTVMVKSGTKQMPSFNLSDKEISSIAEFLKSAGMQGNADPRNFKARWYGIIEPNETK